MDKASYRGWTNPRIYQVVGGFLMMITIICFAYYVTMTFTTNIIYDGRTFLFARKSTLYTKSKASCTCAQNLQVDHEVIAKNTAKKGFDPTVVATITLEEAFFKKIHALDVSQGVDKLTTKEMEAFKTRFLPNKNYMSFPLLTMENVCIDPNGALLLINMTLEEIQANISGPMFIPELYYLWTEIYTCNGNISTDNCVGATFAHSVPINHTMFRGTTAHMLPYIGNSMHNWAERTWPFIAAVSPPFNFTIPYPIDNYIIHRFEKWLLESKYNTDRAQLLWQFRMTMEISGRANPTYLLVRNQSSPVCFEKLVLQQHTRERIDETRLPLKIAGPAVRKYRDGIFAFFGMSKPEVSLPPKKLKVLFYGRNDTSRRRIINQNEVTKMLHNFSRPPLEVHVLDEMLASGETNYTFLEVIRIFSQTDILVIAHGANTWATFLLPEGAGVVEIFGPCNWSGYNHTDLSVMHTWMHVNAAAANLKHDISNPFKEPIANPTRGNTTMCKDPYWGIPDYTIDVDKLDKIIKSFAYPNLPHDHLVQHWLYDWDG